MYNILACIIYCQLQYVGRYMPKDNFTNLGLGSNEMFSVSFYLASYVKHRLLFGIYNSLASYVKHM